MRVRGSCRHASHEPLPASIGHQLPGFRGERSSGCRTWEEAVHRLMPTFSTLRTKTCRTLVSRHPAAQDGREGGVHMFLVTGATGNVGAELVHALAESGERVRAVSRSGRSEGLPAGVEAVAGDLNRPETVRAALDGVRGLFLMPGYGGQRQILADARAAGVRRVVLLSGLSAGTGDRDNAVAGYLLEAEDAVRDSGLA